MIRQNLGWGVVHMAAVLVVMQVPPCHSLREGLLQKVVHIVAIAYGFSLAPDQTELRWGECTHDQAEPRWGGVPCPGIQGANKSFDFRGHVPASSG
jgi:hypothetical protein